MLKLLHVEDDEDIREVAKMALEFSGLFELKQCDCGDAALAEAEAFAPDVMLFDVMMPGMSGPELLLKLREIDSLKDTPTIFMTARAQPSEVQELKDISAITVIVKPFDPVTLGQQIMDALNG